MTTREYLKSDDQTRPRIVRRPATAAGEEAPRDIFPERSASEFPPVLARMPDLEAGETQTSHGTNSRHRRGEGRLLSPPMAVPLLLGAGVVLVLLAVVPMLLDDKDSSQSAATDDSASWHPGVPAPEAPTAAKWNNSAAGQGSTLQALSDAPQQLNWNSPPEHSNWDLESAPSVWDSHSPSTTPGNCFSASADVQQEVPSWQIDPHTAATETQPAITAWHDPGRWPYASGPENDVNSSDGRDPATNMPAGAMANTPPSPSGGYQATPPAPVYSHNYQQPQAGLNQSRSLTDPSALSGDYTSGANSQFARQFDPDTGRQIDYQAGSQTAYQSTYPQATDPNTSHPAGTYQPEHSYPDNTYQADRSQTGGYPVGNYPTAPYATPGLSTETYSAPSYRAEPDTQQAGPGVARFQGVIEKPAVRTSYDRNRSGVY